MALQASDFREHIEEFLDRIFVAAEENEILKRKLLDVEEELAKKNAAIDASGEKLQQLKAQLLSKDEEIKQHNAKIKELDDQLYGRHKNESLVELYKTQFNRATRDTRGLRSELAKHLRLLLDVENERLALENYCQRYQTFCDEADKLYWEQEDEIKAKVKVFAKTIQKMFAYIACLNLTLARHGVYYAVEFQYPEPCEEQPPIDLSSEVLEEEEEGAFFLDPLSYDESKDPKGRSNMLGRVRHNDSLIELCKSYDFKRKTPKQKSKPKKTEAKIPKKDSSSSLTKLLDGIPKIFFISKRNKAEVECKKSKVDAGQPKTTELKQVVNASKQERPEKAKGG